MEIKIIEQNSGWDEFILMHSPWSLFQSWNWGEVQKLMGTAVIRLQIFEQDELVGQAQVFIITARRGTFLHLRHGPIIAKTYIHEKKIWTALVDYLKKIAAEKKAWFIRMSPMLTAEPQLTHLLEKLHFSDAPIHAMDAEICWVLDITKSEEELLLGMRKTTRYLVRQATKLGVTIEQTEDVNEFLTLYKQTAKRQGFVTHHGIAEEFAIFKKKGDVLILNARHEGQTLATALILFWGNQAIYHHGASVQSKIPTSYLLQWEAIKIAQSKQKVWYNFWGIAPDENPNHPWRGLTLFKQGFGGRQQQFMHAQDLATSPLYRLSYAVEHIRKLKKGY